MKAKRSLLVVVAIAITVLLGLQLVRKLVRASFGYTVQSEFRQVPANDSQLTRWLQSQPGVVPSTVTVERMGNGGELIRVFFIQSQNPFGEPPIPKLDDACRAFGYVSPKYKFRDSSTPWVVKYELRIFGDDITVDYDPSGNVWGAIPTYE